MRPTNKRSRSKQNRPRSMGNVVNRVFDSSGPEGKVRGTPQQIIEKYLVLARDAQLSGDRVAAENFQQHAEHYTRMMNEAQAEQAREAEQRRDQQQSNPSRRDDSDGDTSSNPNTSGADTNGGGNGGGAHSGGHEPRQDTRGDRPEWKDRRGNRRINRRDTDPRDDKSQSDTQQSDNTQPDNTQPDNAPSENTQRRSRPQDTASNNDDGSMLVETPESKAAQQRPARTGKAPAAPAETPDASAEEKPKRARKPRAPRVTTEPPANAANSSPTPRDPAPVTDPVTE
nr:DUF4167 domain-containing protein [Pararhodobacter sp.]